jgi:predicted nucleic acid-binding Zn ribbon protein
VAIALFGSTKGDSVSRGEPTPPFRLRALLASVGGRIGIEAADEVGRIWRGWSEIVGPSVAEHAEPTSLRSGVLRVRADSPAWANEIGYLGAEIGTRINAHLGKPLVNEVRVWTGPGPIARVPTSAPTPAQPGDREPAADPVTAFRRAFQAWARVRSRRRDRGSL